MGLGNVSGTTNYGVNACILLKQAAFGAKIHFAMGVALAQSFAKTDHICIRRSIKPGVTQGFYDFDFGIWKNLLHFRFKCIFGEILNWRQ